jgi:hypothetical protein
MKLCLISLVNPNVCRPFLTDLLASRLNPTVLESRNIVAEPGTDRDPHASIVRGVVVANSLRIAVNYSSLSLRVL